MINRFMIHHKDTPKADSEIATMNQRVFSILIRDELGELYRPYTSYLYAELDKITTCKALAYTLGLFQTREDTGFQAVAIVWKRFHKRRNFLLRLWLLLALYAKIELNT